MKVCALCGNPTEGKAVRHPACKDAANFLDAAQRALLKCPPPTAAAARKWRSCIMRLANLAQWRTPKMGANLRRRSDVDPDGSDG